MIFRQESAQTLALQVLGWLAGQDDHFQAFLGNSGTDAAEVRARAADPEMLGSVLDYLLGDDALVIQFCADAGLPPEAPMQARAFLPGGDVPNWT
ncbi:MAG: DUF3572 domain-containing protein [Paracoccaceae bacterium]